MTRYALTVFIILLNSPLISAAPFVVFGADQGWSDTRSTGLTEAAGWRGTAALTLAPVNRLAVPQAESSYFDDFCLIAGESDIENPAGHYSIGGNYEISSVFAARGHTSIRPNPGGIELIPSPSAMWAAGQEWTDFTLDFRLRPGALRNGEVLFSRESRNTDGSAQSITARVVNRRIVWEFDAFFRSSTDRYLNLTLTSPPLIPGEWRHHRIRYQSGSSPDGGAGLFEYLVDGIPAGIIHTTPDGREGHDTFVPHTGITFNAPVYIAPSFSGYTDEWRLRPVFDTSPPDRKYSSAESVATGSGVTVPVDAESSKTLLLRARIDTPGTSGIRFFVRSLNSQYQPPGLPSPDNPVWTEVFLSPEKTDPMEAGQWHSTVLPVEGPWFAAGYILSPDTEADLAPLLCALELRGAPVVPAASEFRF